MQDQISKSAAWWAVALSEEVSSTKPLSVDIGSQALVVWRDQAGIARVLEDRCPHRRAPLSRGCVRTDGLIQCGYHGWSYDGASGKLREIPNMKGEQRFPPLYKAQSFAVWETGGFVRVSLNPDAKAPPGAREIFQIHGMAHVALAQNEYLATLFDDPKFLFNIRGVAFTPYLASELHVQDGLLVMERNCQWRIAHFPAPFSSEFPMTLLSKTDPVTGETRLSLRDAGLNELLAVLLAPVPAAHGVTAIRWRTKLGAGLDGAPAKLFAKLLRVGTPLQVYETIDAANIRTIIPSVSPHADILRRMMLNPGPVMAQA